MRRTTDNGIRKRVTPWIRTGQGNAQRCILICSYRLRVSHGSKVVYGERRWILSIKPIRIGGGEGDRLGSVPACGIGNRGHMIGDTHRQIGVPAVAPAHPGIGIVNICYIVIQADGGKQGIFIYRLTRYITYHRDVVNRGDSDSNGGLI